MFVDHTCFEKKSLFTKLINPFYLFAIKYDIMPPASGIIHGIINWLEEK